MQGLQSSWLPPLTPTLDTCVTHAMRCVDPTHHRPCHHVVMTMSSRRSKRFSRPLAIGYNMAGKTLSVEPTIDPSAKLHETRLGAYTEVGARTVLHEVTMGDYSYVVNDAQITY